MFGEKRQVIVWKVRRRLLASITSTVRGRTARLASSWAIQLGKEDMFLGVISRCGVWGGGQD